MNLFLNAKKHFAHNSVLDHRLSMYFKSQLTCFYFWLVFEHNPMSTKFVTLKFWMYTVPPMEHSDQLKQIGIIKSTDLHLKLYFQHFILCLLAVQLFYLFIFLK